jgi:hypothetical protein
LRIDTCSKNYEYVQGKETHDYFPSWSQTVNRNGGLRILTHSRGIVICDFAFSLTLPPPLFLCGPVDVFFYLFFDSFDNAQSFRIKILRVHVTTGNEV